MAWKDKVMGEIYFYLEKLRKKGVWTKVDEGEKTISIRLVYTNLEYQRKLLDEFIKANGIKMKYLSNRGYFNNLYNDYIRVDLLETKIFKNKRDLKALLKRLKEIYDNFDENRLLNIIEDRVKSYYKYILNDVETLKEREKERRELKELYIKFLNKEIDYDKKIEEFEETITKNHTLKHKLRITKIISNKIRKIINIKNFSLVWVKHGFALIVVYQKKYFDKYWIYENNKFYLIDLRNNKYFDVSEKIRRFEENDLTKRMISDNLYGLKWADLEDLLI